MANKLQSCFPMIRSREEVLTIICSGEKLKNMFYGWKHGSCFLAAMTRKMLSG